MDRYVAERALCTSVHLHFPVSGVAFWIQQVSFLLGRISVSFSLGERICSLPVLHKSKILLLQFLFYLESIEQYPLVLPEESGGSAALYPGKCTWHIVC